MLEIITRDQRAMGHDLLHPKAALLGSISSDAVVGIRGVAPWRHPVVVCPSGSGALAKDPTVVSLRYHEALLSAIHELCAPQGLSRLAPCNSAESNTGWRSWIALTMGGFMQGVRPRILCG